MRIDVRLDGHGYTVLRHIRLLGEPGRCTFTLSPEEAEDLFLRWAPRYAAARDIARRGITAGSAPADQD